MQFNVAAPYLIIEANPIIITDICCFAPIIHSIRLIFCQFMLFLFFHQYIEQLILI